VFRQLVSFSKQLGKHGGASSSCLAVCGSGEIYTGWMMGVLGGEFAQPCISSTFSASHGFQLLFSITG